MIQGGEKTMKRKKGNNKNKEDVKVGTSRKLGGIFILFPVLLSIFADVFFPETLDARERLVGTSLAAAADSSETRRFPAVLSAVQTATLSFTVGGPLVEVRTKAGKAVKKGEILMRIDPRDFQHEVDAAQARLTAAKTELVLMKAGARKEDVRILESKLESAKAQQSYAYNEYERAKSLLPKKAITPSELELMRSNLQSADAQIQTLEQEIRKAKAGERKEEIDVKEAEIAGLEVSLQISQSALGDTNLRAPFDGIVAMQNVNNFEIVHPGTPVITIVDISQLNVTIWIPEREILLSRVYNDIYGTVTFHNLPGKEFPVTLKEAETEANLQTRAWKVVFLMENPPDVMLLPGMTAMLTVRPKDQENISHSSVVIIPVSALCSDSSGQYVWVFSANARAEKRTVKAGRLRSSRLIEIISGVLPGEKIVTSGAMFVKEGDTLKEM